MLGGECHTYFPFLSLLPSILHSISGLEGSCRLWASLSCGFCSLIPMVVTSHPKWKCIFPGLKKTTLSSKSSRPKPPSLNKSSFSSLLSCYKIKPISESWDITTCSSIYIFHFSEEPIVFNGWEIHIASRFIEPVNSSENVSKIFFPSNFMILGEGEGKNRRDCYTLSSRCCIPLLSSLNLFLFFFFVNWKILARVPNCLWRLYKFHMIFQNIIN